jgi:hypothetical protein
MGVSYKLTHTVSEWRQFKAGRLKVNKMVNLPNEGSGKIMNTITDISPTFLP